MIKIINKIKSIFIILIITFVFIEVLSLLFTKMKILKFYNVPTYTLEKKENWFSKDKDLGVWHKKIFHLLKKLLVTKSNIKVMMLGLDLKLTI